MSTLISNIPVASPVTIIKKGMLVKLTSQGYLYESSKNLGGRMRNKSYYDNLVGVVYWKNNNRIAVWWSVFYPYFNSYTSGCAGETVFLSYPIEMENEIMFVELFGGVGGFRLGLQNANKQFKSVWYNEIDKYVSTKLLPEMTKIFPKSLIKKEIIGEIIGFNRLEKSEACEFISSLTGDNSREVVSFGTEAGLFQEIGISTVVCGPGSVEQAHTIDEFVTYEQLKKCLTLLIQIGDFAKN